MNLTKSKDGLTDYHHVLKTLSEHNYGLVLDLLRDGITAIISDGESAGLQIFNALNFCKIRIPRDMSLITWELPHVSSLLSPPVTTVAQDFEQLAEQAISRLECQLNDEIPYQDIAVPYKLFLRESVALRRA